MPFSYKRHETHVVFGWAVCFVMSFFFSLAPLFYSSLVVVKNIQLKRNHWRRGEIERSSWRVWFSLQISVQSTRAMISQFFVLSQRGDNIVFRDCEFPSLSLFLSLEFHFPIDLFSARSNSFLIMTSNRIW